MALYPNGLVLDGEEYHVERPNISADGDMVLDDSKNEADYSMSGDEVLKLIGR